MNYPPYWGAPSPYYPQSGVVYVPMPPASTPPEKSEKKSLEDLINEASAAESAWKRLKKSLQDEKKDDEDKTKKPKKVEMKLTIGDMFMWLMLLSFPMLWAQMKLFHAAQSLFQQ